MVKSMKTAKIAVAYHKRYKQPFDDLYLPVQAGAKNSRISMPYAVKDSTGDNISEKNPLYCELTALYWFWKNCDYDYMGLSHYRRYFTLKKKRSSEPFEIILLQKQLEPLLGRYKVFLPKKRNYYIETLYSHYAHTRYAGHLDAARDIIAEKSPEYSGCCGKVFNSRSGHMFNIMIMEKSLFDSYCNWLFSILFELERRCGKKAEKLGSYQSKFCGAVSEILLNVWIEYQTENGVLKPSEIKELDYIYTEKIDNVRKAGAFIAAKLFGKKYERSF